MSENVCGKCRYSTPPKQDGLNIGNKQLICRRYPPAAFPVPVKVQGQPEHFGTICTFSVVDKGGWCGEFSQVLNG